MYLVAGCTSSARESNSLRHADDDDQLEAFIETRQVGGRGTEAAEEQTGH